MADLVYEIETHKGHVAPSDMTVEIISPDGQFIDEVTNWAKAWNESFGGMGQEARCIHFRV